MKATKKDAEALAGLVKIVWPENSEEALTGIILEYVNSDESAVFAEKRDGSFIGVALCCLRRDYVEGCETSPVGYLEGVSVKENCRNQGVAKRLVEECEQWAREKRLPRVRQRLRTEQHGLAAFSFADRISGAEPNHLLQKDFGLSRQAAWPESFPAAIKRSLCLGGRATHARLTARRGFPGIKRGARPNDGRAPLFRFVCPAGQGRRQ